MAVATLFGVTRKHKKFTHKNISFREIESRKAEARHIITSTSKQQNKFNNKIEAKQFRIFDETKQVERVNKIVNRYQINIHNLKNEMNILLGKHTQNLREELEL